MTPSKPESEKKRRNISRIVETDGKKIAEEDSPRKIWSGLNKEWRKGAQLRAQPLPACFFLDYPPLSSVVSTNDAKSKAWELRANESEGEHEERALQRSEAAERMGLVEVEAVGR